MSKSSRLTPNDLSFIALANEYCETIENAMQSEKDDFINTVCRLLPRIYISASDIRPDETGCDDMTYIDNTLDEGTYTAARRAIETLLGEDDTYLEVFEEDMKYSDTPIAASVAEGLCDIFQVLYDFLEAIRDTTDDNIRAALSLVREDFGQYWSRTLCNVLRAVNSIKFPHD